MIAVEIGALEHSLGGLLATLLQVPEDLGVAIFLAPQAWGARIKVLQTVGNTLMEPEIAMRKWFKGLVSRAENVASRRNKYIHGVWSVDEADPRRVLLLQGPRLTDHPEHIPLEQLTGLVFQIRRLHADMLEFQRLLNTA